MSHPAELPSQEEPAPNTSHNDVYLDALEIIASKYELPIPVRDLFARITIWLDDPKGGADKAIETLRSIQVYVGGSTVDVWSLVESTAKDMQKSYQEKQLSVFEMGKRAVGKVIDRVKRDE